MRNLINILATLVIIAGLTLSTFAPWWVVWFILFPIMYGAILVVLSKKGWIKNF